MQLANELNKSLIYTNVYILAKLKIDRIRLINMRHRVRSSPLLKRRFQQYKSSNWVFSLDSLTSILKFTPVSWRDREFNRDGEKTCSMASADGSLLSACPFERRDKTNLNPELSWLPLVTPVEYPRFPFYTCAPSVLYVLSSDKSNATAKLRKCILHTLITYIRCFLSASSHFFNININKLCSVNKLNFIYNFYLIN